MDAPAVAAYWSSGQQVTGTLTLTSSATTDQQLSLDAATSDPDWSVVFDHDQVTLPAGGTVEVPVTVRVLSDAVVDDAVRVTVRARDTAGGQVTGFATIASDPDAAPVGTVSVLERAGRVAGGPERRIRGAGRHACREHRPGRGGGAV